jgi:hypothetical protein
MVGSVLTDDARDVPEKARCRFRADILTPMTERAAGALRDLNEVLWKVREEGGDMCLHLDAATLPNGSIVLLDNCRWLHARNEGKDEGRH